MFISRNDGDDQFNGDLQVNTTGAMGLANVVKGNLGTHTPNSRSDASDTITDKVQEEH